MTFYDFDLPHYLRSKSGRYPKQKMSFANNDEQPVVKLISQVQVQNRESLLQKIISKDDECDFPS